MNLIDVHCHLDICDDIEGVLERAKASEVKKIITNGINLDSNKKALELSLKYPEIKSARVSAGADNAHSPWQSARTGQTSRSA